MAFVEIPDRNAGDPFGLTEWNSIRDALNKGVMRPIAHTVLSAPALSVTFSTIAADWQDLLLVVKAAHDDLSSQDVLLRFNGDASAVYHYQRLWVSGASAVSGAAVSQTSIKVASSSPVGTQFTLASFTIHDYLSARHKDVTFTANTSLGGVSPYVGSGVWGSVAAINSVSVLNSGVAFAAGSTFNLYGVAGV